MKIKFAHIRQQEKKTFALHMLYSFLDGLVRGILVLNEFVFIKTLKGSDFQIGVLFQFSMVVFIFLIFMNEFLKRTQNKKRLLRITALATQIPLLALSFFPDVAGYENLALLHYAFLGVFLIYYLSTLVTYPTINLFLKSVYSEENFGKFYSYAETIKKVVLLVSTFAFGILLDYNEDMFRVMYAVMAVSGLISLFLLSNIPYKAAQVQQTHQKFMVSVKKSVTNMLAVIRGNKPYLDFEIGFMLYGISFMFTVSVISLFFSKGLELDYTNIAFYKNSYNILAIIILPYMGKLLGKMDPRRFAIITFASLGLYFVFLIFTEYFPYKTTVWNIELYYFLVIAIVFHGVFAATMSLLWYIGSAYFCKAEEADIYQSIHLSLTGVRAAFAPLAGIIFYSFFGYSLTFAIGALCLVIGMILLYISMKKYKLDKK